MDLSLIINKQIRFKLLLNNKLQALTSTIYKCNTKPTEVDADVVSKFCHHIRTLMFPSEFGDSKSQTFQNYPGPDLGVLRASYGRHGVQVRQ